MYAFDRALLADDIASLKAAIKLLRLDCSHWQKTPCPVWVIGKI